MKKIGKLELTWVGKYEEKKIEPRILVENKNKSNISFDEKTKNMLIHGDNLIALKALEQDFSGKIKCIYIDPPYNTGSAFEHYDDGLEHSIWLCLMKSRLEILHRLLSKDGVLFVQIDENEYPYLKILLHEIFGRGNEIGDFIWQKKKGGGNDSRYIAIEHENIIAIAKDKTVLPYWFAEYDIKYLARYKEQDEQGRFFWDTYMRASGKQYYSIICPDGTILDKDRNGQPISWLRSEQRFKHDLEIGAARIIKIGNKWSVQFKQYMSEGKKPRSILTDMPTNADAKNEMTALFGVPKAFDFPKPEGLIKFLLSIVTKPGDIVLDSFLGSGTTAAVAHKMDRQWIGIESGNHAYSHCKVRLDKVVEGDQGGISKDVNWNGGGGYRFYELAPSLLEKNPTLSIYQVNKKYTFEMLCEAICKIEGFKYKTVGEMHGKSSETRYIHISKDYISGEYIKKILKELDDNYSVLIYGTKIQSNMKLPDNVEVKRIPKDLLKKFDFESGVK